MVSESVKNRIVNYLFPRYDELTLFLYGVLMMLFAVSNMGDLYDLFAASIPVSSAGDLIKSFLVILAALFIMALPVYHAFSKRKKRGWEKGLMLTVIILLNFIIAWNAYDYLKDRSTRWELIFPAINAIQASLVIAGWRYNIVTLDKISDGNADTGEVVLSGVLAVLLFVLYRYVLKAYWAVAFSVCIFYATMINRLIIAIARRIKNG